MSRRDFLKRTAGTAAAVPTLAAILEACAKPGQVGNVTAEQLAGSGGLVIPGSPYPLARPDKPVTWKIYDDNQPIAGNLQPESGATLQIYNWVDYLWKQVVQSFCDQYNCDYKITTFNNMDEALAKMRTGQLKIDVFFPTIDSLGKLVASKLLQPLNQSYIPNLAANAWDVYQNPYYDQKWQYTVPYTVYTTGIEYRRDVISDDQIRGMTNPFDLFWDTKYKGKVGIYDSYRDAMGLTLQKRHIDDPTFDLDLTGALDVNTTDPKIIAQMGQDLIGMTNAVNVTTTINGAYAGLPKGNYDIHQAWSGDAVAAWFYTPDQNMNGWQTIGYWYPSDRVGEVDNDLIAIPANAESPVLAHLFLNYMLDFKHAMDNFAWVGYQPPQKDANPETLTRTTSVYKEPYVFPWLSDAIVYEDDFKKGEHLLELSPPVDSLWHDAWSRFQSSG